MPEHKPWRRHSRTAIYENPWLTVVEDHLVLPSDSIRQYGLIQFKNNAVGILPVDDKGNIFLVGQYRYAIDSYSWEIPCGGQPRQDNTLEGAKRELREETGLSATSWRELAVLHTSNSVTDEFGIIYLAKNLSAGETRFDETEEITVKTVSTDAAMDMVMNGNITDAISQIAIMKYMLLEQTTP